MSTAFEKQLIKHLRNFMQSEVTYSPSYRVEGMLQQDVESIAPKKAAILVDAALNQEAFDELSLAVCNTLRKDFYFKETAYSVWVWTPEELTRMTVSGGAFIKPRFLDKLFELVDVSALSGGSWTNLRKQYLYVKQSPLVIMMTTEDRLSELENSEFMARNMIIVYQAKEAGTIIRKVRNIVCVPKMTE